jgi:hypothetical protein
MTHAILIQNDVAAENVRSYNRSVISASNVDNGNVFYMYSKYEGADGYDEVFEVKQPTTGSLTDLWMAASPEIVLTDSKYRGINPDAEDFYNSASFVFDAFKPVAGDIITLTGDGLTGTAEKAFAVSAVTSFKPAWADAPSGSLLSLKYIETTNIPYGSGSAVGSQRRTAYKFEVLYNEAT